MSMYLGPEGQQVASNRGWADVVRWSHTLDPGRYPELVHLCEHGWSQQVSVLKDELSRVTPSAVDVRTTIYGLRDILDASWRCVWVTSGLSEVQG